MTELIYGENNSKTELVIARSILIERINTFLKNNICEKCRKNPCSIITYPNGNKYCVHRIKEANQKFKKAYDELSYAFNKANID